MPSRTQIRNQGQVSFRANATESFNLGLGATYRELRLRLRSKPTIAGAANTTANAQRGDDWGVVKGLNVVANGGDVLRTFSGDELRWLNRLFYRAPFKLLAALGDGATADPSLDSTLILPFWSPGLVKPWDTALNSARLNALRLDVQFGAHTDINSAATGFTTAPTLDIISDESWGHDANDEPGFVQRNTKIQQDFAAANTRARISLGTGEDMVYRGLLVNTRNTASPAVDVSNVVNNFKIESGPVTYYDEPAVVAADASMRRLGIHDGWDFGSASVQRISRNTKNHQEGWYLLDFVRDGYPSECIDAQALPELFLTMDVLAACQIHVIPLLHARA